MIWLPKPDVIYIAVGTPSSENGTADLRYVRAAADAIGKYLPDHYVVVVNRSTVPIGSASMVEDLVRHSFEAHRRNGKRTKVPQPQLGVAFQP